jgi:hypothetical protein
MSHNIKTDSKILNDRLSHIFGTGPLGKFRDYLDLMESYLQLELDKHNASYSKDELEEYSKTAGEHHQEYLCFLAKEHFMEKKILAFDFPHSLRTALIIQVFSFFEFELKNICLYHSTSNCSFVPFDNLKKESEILKSKRYLTEGAKINFEILSEEWRFLDCVRIIRNFFVHNQGIIKDDNRDFQKIKKFADVNNLKLRENVDKDRVTAYQFIIPNKVFPERVIDNVNLFLNKLLKELKI